MIDFDRQIRKLEQSKRSETVGVKHQPSFREMKDGDERVVLAGGNTLRLYRKEFGKLWYIEFIRT
jgi:hypothetical protein